MDSNSSSLRTRAPQKRTLDDVWYEWTVKDFDLGGVIGSGSYGTVVRAKEKITNQEVAIKIIEGSLTDIQLRCRAVHELVILDFCQHPHVVKQFFFFYDDHWVYSVMELASCNSLYNVMAAKELKRFSEAEATKYVWQVATAVAYIHSRGFMHRDIKTENVLVGLGGEAKLGDFGFATSTVCERHDYCGTVECMAPEIIARRAYTHSVDIWAVGVLAFELLVGKSPFSSKNKIMTKKKIRDMNFRFPSIVEPAAREFILKLIVRDPQNRLELSEALKHPWLSAHSTELSSL